MIVRELVTKLGFTVDRSNLDKFERSIASFKTKVGVAATAVGFAFKQVIDFASNISDAGVATKDLADYAGVAVKDFVALKNVAEKFAIKPEKFDAAFNKLAIGIKEASRGAGEFFEIARQSQGKITFRGIEGQLLNVRDVFLQIFDYVNNIGDKSEQLRILGNFFDAESAGAWLRVIEQGKEQFAELVQKEIQFGESFENAVPSLQKYQMEISSLNKEMDKLLTTVGQAIVPVLGQTLGGVNAVIGDFKEEGFSSTLKNIGNSFLDAFDFSKLFHDDDELEIMRAEVQRQRNAPFWDKLEAERVRAVQGASAGVVNNNRFEFNVPPGTTEQQATYMSEMVKQTVSQIWDEKTREVINNSPQVG